MSWIQDLKLLICAPEIDQLSVGIIVDSAWC